VRCFYITKLNDVKEHPHLFDAKYVDYVWHLGFCQLIAFADTASKAEKIMCIAAMIDDCSFFIVHHMICTKRPPIPLSKC
jgi:hypothetical protein